MEKYKKINSNHQKNAKSKSLPENIIPEIFFDNNIACNSDFEDLSTETQEMIDELEKNVVELAKSQEQINQLYLPREIVRLNDVIIPEEECEADNFLSDATSDYSLDEDENEPRSTADENNDNKDEIINNKEYAKTWKPYTSNSSKTIDIGIKLDDTNSIKNFNSYNSRRLYFQKKKVINSFVDSFSLKNENENKFNLGDKSFESTKTGSSQKLDEKQKLNIETSPRSLTLSIMSNHDIENEIAKNEGYNIDSIISGKVLPDKILVQIISLDFNKQFASNTKTKTSIRLVIHCVTYQTKPSESIGDHSQKKFLFPFDCHSLMFDNLKIDIYEHGFLNAKKKIGRGIFKFIGLKPLIPNKDEFIVKIPLESNGRQVATVQISIKFHYPNDPPLISSTSDTRKTPIRSNTVPLRSTTNQNRDATMTKGISSEIDNADDTEFANVVVYPESMSLGILDMVLSKETRDAIKEITVLYNTFFDHGWRLSKLEFLKAYMLLEKYYTQKPSPVTGKICHDIDKIQLAQKYLKYSMASYGSFLFNWFGYGHNMAPINRKAIQEFFGLDKDDIICWEYGLNTVSVPNYMIIRDPETNNLIITIRGTMNVTDVITDVLARYESWNGGLVHRGVLRSAQYLVKRSLKSIKKAVKKFNSRAIQVIGHSLGASISSIVTLLLHEECKSLLENGIEILAWNFATAPCCSLDLAKKPEAMNYINNFINENDVIPRLSYGNLMDFKELVKFAASELKNENYKKFNSSEKLSKILTSIDKYRTSLKAKSSEQKLYIPGTIYYLYKGFHRTHVKSSIAFYTKDIVCEISTPNLFTDICLKRNWLFHHFPDRYDKKFQGVVKFLTRKLSENDKGASKFWNKWKRMKEAEYIVDEGGRMEKWMSRSGHI
nr:7788_t:CDS:10 [Entrophospora candida]